MVFWRSQDEKSNNVDLANVLNFVSSQINKHTAKTIIFNWILLKLICSIVNIERTPTEKHYFQPHRKGLP